MEIIDSNEPLSIISSNFSLSHFWARYCNWNICFVMHQWWHQQVRRCNLGSTDDGSLCLQCYKTARVVTIFLNPDTVRAIFESWQSLMQHFAIPTKRQKPPHPQPATHIFRDVSTSDTSPIGGISAIRCPAANKINDVQLLAATMSN